MWRWAIAGLWLAGCQGPVVDDAADVADGDDAAEAARRDAPAPSEVPVPAAPPVATPEPAPTVAPEPGLPPLSAGQRATLLAGPEERIVSRREHFTVSNEYRHDLWFPYLRGLGGVHVGVASDQNYTLMAVAGSEVGYLIDLDRDVVRLHRVYMALIAASPDPEGFLARFDAAAQAETARLIEAGLADMPADDRAAAHEFVGDHREALRAYLGGVRAPGEHHAGTWLSNPELYEHMREMVAGGRLRPINGNLAGKTAMKTIAAGARALGLPVKTLYLSNAEEYLSYTAAFADNVRALPGDPGSVVLRTIHDRFTGWEDCGEGDRRWNYQVQPLADFQARLGERRNNARTAMLARAVEQGAIDRVARGVSVFKPPADGLR